MTMFVSWNSNSDTRMAHWGLGYRSEDTNERQLQEFWKKWYGPDPVLVRPKTTSWGNRTSWEIEWEFKN